MQIKANQYKTGGNSRPSLRCPGCRQIGIFEVVTQVPDVLVQHPTHHLLGLKQCPNSACSVMVYVIMDSNQRPLRTYPAERIDFDVSGVPASIVGSLEEALTCHAEGCYVACAIMVRRTLEQLCDDKGSAGKNLKDRISGLRNKVVLPSELFTAMDELRLLGNDAAHIEARVYVDVSKEETEIAIDLTKEILKAVYQLDGLVKRLQLLKKP